MAIKGKWAVLIILIALAVGGGVIGYARWRHAQIFLKTENAYVNGNIFRVASRIPGKLSTLSVEENQAVTKGSEIATIDPAGYDAAVSRKEAALAEAKAGVLTGRAAISQARARVEAAVSRLNLAKIEKKRFSALYQRESVPKQKFDQAATGERIASAQLEAARKTVAFARADLVVKEKKIAAAEASLRSARLNRSYCTILAPATGYISQKSAEVGDVVAPGQPICAVVPLNPGAIWVEANYKETQLKRVMVGQKVSLKADVDKSRTFTGTVESLSAGTGASFSLFPPENATGNWVKVVQRLPVRIRINPGSDPDHILRLGLSVTCVIDTRPK